MKETTQPEQIEANADAAQEKEELVKIPEEEFMSIVLERLDGLRVARANIDAAIGEFEELLRQIDETKLLNSQYLIYFRVGDGLTFEKKPKPPMGFPRC